MTEFWAALAGAALLTSVVSVFGFNRPTWLRTYTTAGRYYDALAIHMLLYVGVLLLACVPLYPFRQSLGGRDAVAALALVVGLAVRMLPWSARRMRNWAHRVAGIPATGRSFAANVAEAPFEASPPAQQEATRMLVSRRIDPRQDWLPPVRPVLELALTTTTLFLQLRKWEEDRRFTDFLVETRNEFDLLRQRFDRLLLSVARALSEIDKLGKLHFLAAQGAANAGAAASEHPDDLVKGMVNHTVSGLCDDLRQFYRDACLFAVRGVMTVHWTRRGRSAALVRIGFAQGRYEPAPGYAIVLFQTTLVMYFGCWIFLLLGGSTPQQRGMLDPGAKILLVTLLVIASIMLAALPKLRWAFANAGLHRRTPVGFVVGAGLAAILAGIGLSLLAGALFLGGSHGAVAAARETAVILPSLFCTAALTAWLVQDHRWGAASERSKRCYDALAFAGVWMASTLLWAGLMGADSVANFTGMPARAFGSEGPALGFALVVGSTIGYFMPHAARKPQARVAPATEPRDVKLLLAEVERLAGFAARESEAASAGAAHMPAISL